MTFPIWSLSAERHELGLLAGVAVGFAFGFVMERAGFGRAQKLAAQFYGNDMTVLKVMFSAIVTAMLGTVLLGGVGILDYRALVEHAVSETFLWPMILGGLALGAGFVVSGYCPGTSYVAAASGKVDGMVTVLGVVAGQLAYAGLEHRGWLARFHASGASGQLFLQDLLHLPARAGAPLAAAAVTALAVGCFLGAEKLESALSGKARAPASPAGRSGRFVFAGMSACAVLGLAAAALPAGRAAEPRAPERIGPDELARRVFERPWGTRVLDLRPTADCAAQRVPGAECAPAAELAALHLAGAGGAKDLVLLGEGDLAAVPPAATGYPGAVLLLAGGWKAWEAYALTPPPAPAPDALAAERHAYRQRAGLASALTGMKAAPPPPHLTAAPPTPRHGGGCGG